MLILTGIRSVGLALSTVKSDLISGAMNQRSSVPSMNVINTTQHTDTTAPATVGCVRSFGNFRYKSNFFTSNPIVNVVLRITEELSQSYRCKLPFYSKKK